MSTVLAFAAGAALALAIGVAATVALFQRKRGRPGFVAENVTNRPDFMSAPEHWGDR